MIGIFGILFNVGTLVIVVSNRSMRRRPSYVPIISFLLGSGIQGATAFPLYVFKKLANDLEIPDGICDAYRIPYFYCGHIMKLSLFYVSIDRLFAIKSPYIYREKMSTKRFAIVIVISWLVTLFIDLVPFLASTNFVDECNYRPNHEWGFSVIILFNIIPLLTIIICYSMICHVALRIDTTDRQLAYIYTPQESQQSNKQTDLVKHETNIGDYRQHCHQDNSSKTQKRCTCEATARCITCRTSIQLKRFQHGLEMKATKTSFVLIITYIFCWGPLGVFYMMDHFCDYCYSAKDDLTAFRMWVKILAFTSSFSAPLTYCWWNQEFRGSAIKCVKKVFKK